MGGKSSAGSMPTGPARAGGAGKGGGGGGGGKGGGGRGPMTAEQADAANQTRRQNVFTTVGGLSRPGGGDLRAPPNPRERPSGPSGPPTKMGGTAPTTPFDPTRAYGASAAIDPATGLPVRGGPPLSQAVPALPPGVAPPPTGIGMAPSSLAGLFQNSINQTDLEFDPMTGKMRPKQRVLSVSPSLTRV